MPGGDGYQLIRAVRALSPAEGGLTPAVALTAYGTERDRVQAREAGFDQHVIKPVTPALVISAVAELAGRSMAPG
jgi:CheY-like chemotaxis protein